MFQQYEVKSDPSQGSKRLARLRQIMRENGASVFLVPHADEHQNEYCPPHAERLAWLTGFTGSAGYCIVTLEKAVIFVDGRYTLQVREQVDTGQFEILSLVDTPPAKWLGENTGKQDTIVFDPWLVTISQHERHEKAIQESGARLVPGKNLLDLAWDNQPCPPLGAVKLQPEQYAGRGAIEKIEEVRDEISRAGADACLLTDPASLAWLFNIRGTDVVHNPLVLGFCILPVRDKPMLFIDERKLDATVRSTMEAIADIHSPQFLLEELAAASSGKTILCDPELVANACAQRIRNSGGTIKKGRDPVVLPRAIKNEAEIGGSRNAHLRDGVAVTKFLYWLANQPAETLDEITAAKKLEMLRAETARAMDSELLEISFDTISGFGSNGAIVHYRVNTDSNASFANGNLYLCDSGAQYVDGTTDITRTVAIGSPPDQARTDFTLVLKGHIAIATARFPKGTRGVDLDPLARAPLWRQGKDFAHGTGHGIGAYLNVHEGPQGISRRAMEPFQSGMIISNEPGFYVEGQYGIRVENLVLVTPAENTGGNIETHAFETLTLAPIDLDLVDRELLSGEERNWLNSYHANVFSAVEPYLEPDERAWLENATRPV